MRLAVHEWQERVLDRLDVLRDRVNIRRRPSSFKNGEFVVDRFNDQVRERCTSTYAYLQASRHNLRHGEHSGIVVAPKNRSTSEPVSQSCQVNSPHHALMTASTHSATLVDAHVQVMMHGRQQCPIDDWCAQHQQRCQGSVSSHYFSWDTLV